MSPESPIWYAEVRRACRGALYLLSMQTPAVASRLSFGFAWLSRAINDALDARRDSHHARLVALFDAVGPPPPDARPSHLASWGLAQELVGAAAGGAPETSQRAARWLRWVAEDLLDATHPRWHRDPRIVGPASALLDPATAPPSAALLGAPLQRLGAWLRGFDGFEVARRLPTAGVTLAIGVGVTSSDSARQIADLLAGDRGAALGALICGAAALAILWTLHRLAARRHGAIHPLMIGWEPFLWMKGYAQPARGEVRLIAPGEELTQALGAALGVQLVVLGATWSAVLILLGTALDDGARTAASLTALFGIAAQLSVFLDYVVYHFGWRLRRLFLLVTGGLLVADNALGGELFVSAIFGALSLTALGVVWAMAWTARSIAPARPWWKISGAIALALSAGLLPSVWLNAQVRGQAPWPADGPAWQRVASSTQPVAGDISGCAWPRDEAPPVALFAFAGGGSRSAIFAGLAMERVADLDTQIAAEGLPTILDHAEAVSSVSGGSLANAALVERLRSGRSLEGLSDALGGDFLYPVLSGFLVPGGDRAANLVTRWQTPGLLGDPTPLSALAACWCGDCPPEHPGDGRFPLPLFNAATVDGYRVVLSPLAHRAYVSRALTDHARTVDAYADPADPMWVYYRDGIYGLEEQTTFDPTMAQSVLASANFPFGFPLLRYASDGQDWHFHTPTVRRAATEGFLTDGGVLVNSGLWSLYTLMSNHAEALAERGVLLVLVDSSWTPPAVVPSKHAGLAMTIAVKNNVIQRLHRLMLGQLDQMLGDRLQVVIVSTSPEREHDVVTSWYLPERQRQNLETSFEAVRPAFERDLLDAWRTLNGRGDRQPVDWTDHPRPPLF